MSLAGLDTPAVVEAHQASIAEPSGWFLLKYVVGSRDTVELLKRGSNGVNEARNAVEAYGEKSPLYGLIQFRRRKIILKYVPDGTSRVLQVRLTVQFQAVLDVFTPHDTVFSFATGPELTESALALSVMLLPSTASLNSSSSSDRRRRLNEISEDVEDINDTPKQQEILPQAQETATPIPERSKDDPNEFPDELPASALRAKALLARRKGMDTPSPEPTPPKEPMADKTVETTITLETAPLPTQKENLLVGVPSQGVEKALPAIPSPSPLEGRTALQDSEQNHQPTPVELPASADTSHPTLISAHLEHPRHLSTTDSDSIKEWSNNVASFTAIKPKKKKLGPRPHIEGPGRPRTSGTSERDVSSGQVANLPNSVRVATSRPTTSNTNRPGSQQSSKSVPGRFPATDMVHIMPPLPSPTHIASMYRPESRASFARPPSITENSNVTPEKLRLMKALQLRKKNILVAQRASASTGASAHTPTESLASTNTSAGVHLSRSLANAGFTESADSKTLLSSSTASPRTLTNLSEAQSTKASSFTSHEEANKRRESLSSDTGSSITPKAPIEGEKKRKSVRKSPSARVEPIDAADVMEDRSTEQQKLPGNSKDNNAVTGAESNTDSSAVDMSQSAPGSKPIATDGLSGAQRAISSDQPLSTNGSRTRRGRPVPEHLRMASTAEVSELSEEETFLDELENATVHEAKPVSVARTPVTPVMSKVNSDRFKDATRSVSTPIAETRHQNPTRPQSQPRTLSQIRTQSSASSIDKPKSAGSRMGSTALPHWPPLPSDPVPGPLTNKSTLGLGISKRIKALEVLSTRESTSPPRQPVKSEPSTRSAFIKFMKRSSMILDQKPAHNTSTENSPPKKLPDTLAQRGHPTAVPQPWVQRQGSATQVFHPTQKGETVSVTARIIRDDRDGVTRPPTEPDNLNLYQSPLIVEHEKQNDDHSPTKRDISTADSKSPKAERGRFSFSSQRLHTSDSFASKRSITGAGRKHLPRSQSDNSSFTEDKPKTSRANRFLKRVSNLASGRRSAKSQTSSPHSEQTHPDTIEERIEPDNRKISTSESLLHVVDIGDVNVQFPESLLWKRRFIRIDDQGFLIFSPPANEANSRGVSRKFHLNDFRTPMLPDPEREEMAWSIIMDLKDGRSLQYACESRRAQRHVLQMLVDAHSAYHQLYGT